MDLPASRATDNPRAGEPTTLRALADLVQGEVIGDSSARIHGAATLELVLPGQITLADTPERLNRLRQSPATAVVLPRGLQCDGIPAIAVDDVHAAFSRIVEYFLPPRRSHGVQASPSNAFRSPSAVISPGAHVHPLAVIADDVVVNAGCTIHAGVVLLPGCRVDCDSTIFPHAVLYENTRVGRRCIIHAGVVLGAYGFGYTTRGGQHSISAQLGWVEIGDDVEIGANTTIDRGTYGPTLIGAGTKIDNLVMVAHNCRIGSHNLLCSQVGVAGSTTTGDHVVMGGQVGVRDHVHIGAGARLGAQAGVSNDVPDGEQMLGTPATTLRQARLQFASIAKLPEMRRAVRAIERRVESMERQLADWRRTIDPPSRAA